MRLSFSSLLSARLLSLRGFACLPCDSFAWVKFFSLVFSPFDSFRLRFFSPPRRDILRLLVRAICVRLLLPRFFGDRVSLFFSFCIYRSRFHCFISCFIHPSSLFCFVSCFTFLFVFPCAELSSSLPVLSASLSFFLWWITAWFSGHCLLISFPVRSRGHRLLGFLRLCLFLFCAFGSIPCDFPASSLVPLGSSQSSSGSAALLWSLLGLPVLSFAYLQSWASLLRVFTPCLVCLWVLFLFRCSCLRLRYSDAFCPFCLLLLLVVASVVGRLLSSSMMPSLCYCHYFGVSLPSPCVSVSFGSVPLFRGGLVFFSWGLERLFVTHHPVSLVSCSLLSFMWQYWCLWYFCLVRISGSLRDVVSLWDESGFAESSVSLGSQGSFHVVVSLLYSVSVPLLLGLICI